jgi:16S rRNA C967 or C1407 C5-methylase (RsmB/RsmF family)
MDMPIDDDYEKIKNEIISERVAETIKKDPEHWADRLEDIGFFWVDDRYGDQEEQEEKRAKPENTNQEFLAGYFDAVISG